ncbi:MAG TPA: alanine racemase [Acidimicrobiales bacterium]|nr:alanine racemase [Acidimicrobiales bacterium]
MAEAFRPAWVEVDLAAVRHNAGLLARLVAPAQLCAVVKADGYGHGAPDVAAAALDGGATWLAVALVEEGLALRAAGVTAPVLLLSEPTDEAMREAVAHGLTPTLYRHGGVAAARRAATGVARPVPVHLKVDTGMHRVGASPRDAPAVARAIASAPELELEGLFTHLAVADEPDDPFTAHQLRVFDEVRRELADDGIRPAIVHAANSAGAIAHPAARLDLVRCGIACYGHLPSPALAGHLGAGPPPARFDPGAALRPALSLRARVHLVRELAAGERTSYGLAYELPLRSQVAVIPLGYHDGVPRALERGGGEVLVGGRRRRIAGTVTMDQIIVDCGPDGGVRPGDEAVLIGPQGDEEITAEEWAERLGTICYEVLCGIGPRVPRVAVHRQDAATPTGAGGQAPGAGGCPPGALRGLVTPDGAGVLRR